MTERVRVAVRVPERLKEIYEEELLETYVQTRPYAGTELEKELRIALDMGEESEMFDTLRDLVADPPREKNSEKATFSGGEKIVNYRIDPTVRAELKRASQQGVATMGEIVARVMYHYAMGDGHQARMRDLVQDLDEDGVEEDDALSATERREVEIAEYLEENAKRTADGPLFAIEDFDEAVREGCSSLSPSDYVRENYLKPVLDRLDVKPTASGNFMPEEEGAIEDPRGLPYEAMDEVDVADAIKAAAIEDRDRRWPFTATDAQDVLDGGPRKDTIRRHMKEIGETEGFVYRKGEGRIGEPFLRVTTDVLYADWEHERALRMAGLLEEVNDDASVRTPSARVED